MSIVDRRPLKKKRGTLRRSSIAMHVVRTPINSPPKSKTLYIIHGDCAFSSGILGKSLHLLLDSEEPYPIQNLCTDGISHPIFYRL